MTWTNDPDLISMPSNCVERTLQDYFNQAGRKMFRTGNSERSGLTTTVMATAVAFFLVRDAF